MLLASVVLIEYGTTSSKYYQSLGYESCNKVELVPRAGINILAVREGKMKTSEYRKSVQSEAILRLNCPGYGSSGLLTCGKARPLTDYKVIIVNPISIVHLFEEDELLMRQIDTALAEGLSTHRLGDSNIIERISQQIEARSPELFQFLAEGGLLIYYLCRPFVINSENRSMDNYAWLCGLAPDQSGEVTTSEQTVRHMSTVAHGRNIDKCLAASESEFDKYLEQVGLEWNTIIRTDFLTSGYSPLAQAGPKKCIAGELIAGDNGGRVVFLPAPYSPDFDRALIECINIWQDTKMGSTHSETAGSKVTLPGDLNGQNGPEGAGEDTQMSNSSQEDFALKPPTQMNEFTEESAIRANLKAENLQHETERRQSNIIEDSDFGDDNRQFTGIQRRSGDQAASKLSPAKEKPSIPTTGTQKNAEEKVANEFAQEAKMPRVTEGISEAAAMPEWCNSYWLPGMDGLIKEIQSMHKQLAELERKLEMSENMVSALEGVKATLLSGKPGNLLESCQVVLRELGFSTEVNGSDELVLAENDQHLAVVRLSVSTSSPERGEIAKLTESLIKFWDSHGIEPKGILIACTYCDTPLPQRKEADFSNFILDFAVKKNICLISTAQLISMYLDMKFGRLDANKLRGDILSTAGALKGYSL